jgi:ethanolamine ammonia-lyase small subunit
MAAEENDRAADKLAQAYELSETVNNIRARTPARLLAGRSGAAYRTNTLLELREAHAVARDAVRADFSLFTNAHEDFVRRWDLFAICSCATSKDEYLLRPDLGRRLNEASRAEVNRRCIQGQDMQIVIGDGLSVTAVAAQVPRLFQPLYDGAIARGWSLGNMFVVRHCRVGILNEIGELLRPRVAVLLIGERPGLASAEGLSAYMAYQPKASDTDANRNLISNIHSRGLNTEQAAERILNLAASMMRERQSGYRLRERLPEEVPHSLRQS